MSNVSFRDKAYAICKRKPLKPLLLTKLTTSLHNHRDIYHRHGKSNEKSYSKKIKIPTELFKHDCDRDLYMFGFIIYFCYSIGKLLKTEIDPEISNWNKMIFQRLVGNVTSQKSKYGVWKTVLIDSLSKTIDAKTYVKDIELFYTMVSFDSMCLTIQCEYLLHQIKPMNTTIYKISPTPVFSKFVMETSSKPFLEAVDSVLILANKGFTDEETNGKWWKERIQSDALISPLFARNAGYIKFPSSFLTNSNLKNLYIFGFLVCYCSAGRKYWENNEKLSDGLMNIFLNFKPYPAVPKNAPYEKQWAYHLQQNILIHILAIHYDATQNQTVKQKIIEIITPLTHEFVFYPYQNTIEYEYLFVTVREKIHASA
jgi:hypothetical protein